MKTAELSEVESALVELRARTRRLERWRMSIDEMLAAAGDAAPKFDAVARLAELQSSRANCDAQLEASRARRAAAQERAGEWLASREVKEASKVEQAREKKIERMILAQIEELSRELEDLADGRGAYKSGKKQSARAIESDDDEDDEQADDEDDEADDDNGESFARKPDAPSKSKQSRKKPSSWAEDLL